MPAPAPLSALLPRPLPFTSSPVRLLWNDILLFIALSLTWPPTAGLPSIVLPIYPFQSGKLDELYPSLPNLWSVFVQVVLLVVQATFLLALIPSALIGLPVPFHAAVYLTAIVVFVLVNAFVSDLTLNGWKHKFVSDPEITAGWPRHDGERWLFINGVAAGSHWLQSNLDRLALTFRRPVRGIHNRTRGIIFDVIECIMQRSFGYDTNDIRDAYKEIAQVLGNDQTKKVMVVLHSQGGIEGSMVLDWLYATLPTSQVSKLEVYTFGNAANHFNSPVLDEPQHRTTTTKQGESKDRHPESGRVIRHIEHYANTGDWVSRFGILHFRPTDAGRRQTSEPREEESIRSPSFQAATTTGNAIHRQRRQKQQQELHSDTNPPPSSYGRSQERQQHQQRENQYIGRLFQRQATGHQFNGNYLDNFFAMSLDIHAESGSSLKPHSAVAHGLQHQRLGGTSTVYDRARVLDQNPLMDSFLDEQALEVGDVVVPVDKATSQVEGLRVKDVSRLWRYRNGRSPESQDDD